MGDDIKRIEAIVTYCKRIEEKINEFGKDEDEFFENLDYQQICSFCVLQIGENIKSLSPELIEKYPEIQWRGISGMRDIIAHGYEKINLDIVWTSITKKIPALRETCEKILEEPESLSD
ncbi:MAG: DUF86 domain-containing protein [Methanomassiliicoccaceae archaeon]|nr:DUF86 domain-containing protein [Methanomassiliicoccaceae archaeon]